MVGMLYMEDLCTFAIVSHWILIRLRNISDITVETTKHILR
jgi:hypothetical protein